MQDLNTFKCFFFSMLEKMAEVWLKKKVVADITEMPKHGQPVLDN